MVNQLFAHNYPTWVVGVSLSYPLGQSTEEANHARARLELVQAGERLKGSQARAIQQVRDAAYKIDMNAKRIATTRAATNLAEQRLDAEQKRFEVGLSTSFLVIQAQRDLAQAKANEVSAGPGLRPGPRGLRGAAGSRAGRPRASSAPSSSQPDGNARLPPPSPPWPPGRPSRPPSSASRASNRAEG